MFDPFESKGDNDKLKQMYSNLSDGERENIKRSAEARLKVLEQHGSFSISMAWMFQEDIVAVLNFVKEPMVIKPESFNYKIVSTGLFGTTKLKVVTMEFRKTDDFEKVKELLQKVNRERIDLERRLDESQTQRAYYQSHAIAWEKQAKEWKEEIPVAIESQPEESDENYTGEETVTESEEELEPVSKTRREKYKITDEIRSEVHRLTKETDLSVRDIAVKLNISPPSVINIRREK